MPSTFSSTAALAASVALGSLVAAPTLAQDRPGERERRGPAAEQREQFELTQPQRDLRSDKNRRLAETLTELEEELRQAWSDTDGQTRAYEAQREQILQRYGNRLRSLMNDYARAFTTESDVGVFAFPQTDAGEPKPVAEYTAAEARRILRVFDNRIEQANRLHERRARELKQIADQAEGRDKARALDLLERENRRHADRIERIAGNRDQVRERLAELQQEEPAAQSRVANLLDDLEAEITGEVGGDQADDAR